MEDQGTLIKGTTETVMNKTKRTERWFSKNLLETLGSNLLENLLSGKETTAGKGELAMEQLGLGKVFNAASSFN